MQQTRSRAPAFAALKNRNYRWYFASGLGMTASQFIQPLALSWLVLDLTGSVGELGFVIFMQGLPMAIISLFGGVFADRYNRRYLLMGAQSVTMFNMLVLSILTMAGLVEVWQVYISAMLLGTAQALTMPSRNALVSSLVDKPDMMNAVALNTMQQQSSRIIWPSFAGILIGLVGVGPTLATCAVASFIGIFSLSMMRGVVEQPRRHRTTSALQEIGEGVRYSFSHRRVAAVVGLGMSIGMFGLAFQQLAPGFARTEMDFTSSQAGFFVMAAGIGATLGSSLLVVLNPSNHHRLFFFACAGYGSSLLLISLNPWYLPAFVCMGLYGLFNSNYAVSAQTIFQLEVPPELLGRVVSLWAFAGGLGSITALPIALAGEALGLRWALGAVACVLMSISTIVGLRFSAAESRDRARLKPLPSEAISP